jgi:hypothetical protein
LICQKETKRNKKKQKETKRNKKKQKETTHSGDGFVLSKSLDQIVVHSHVLFLYSTPSFSPTGL